MKLHHIGYLISDMEAARGEFRLLGFCPAGETVYDPARDVHICFLRADGVTVELVCPASPGSPLAPLLKKIKNAPYHACFQVDGIEAAQETLFARGYVPVRPPEPAAAFGGKRVAFYMHGGIGMIELLES